MLTPNRLRHSDDRYLSRAHSKYEGLKYLSYQVRDIGASDHGHDSGQRSQEENKQRRPFVASAPCSAAEPLLNRVPEWSSACTSVDGAAGSYLGDL